MSDASLTIKVARKWQEARDICGFEFVSDDGSPLPGFTAGAHIDVHLPGGLVRQYSLCNHPAQADRYQIAVLLDAEGRGGSRAIHDAVRQGDTVRISTPRNHFPLAAGAAHHLLLAGGIGVTPILSMAERLSSSGEPFAMHYCARSTERMAFVERIAASAFRDRVRLHVDDGEPAQRFDLAAVLAAAPEGTHLYVCGPRGFMDAVLNEARARNWAEERLHYEFFGGAVETSAADRPFQVRIASSGRVIDVPAECTVVAALAANGVDVLTSCEQGVCGTCLTRVLDGEPEHRDSYLTDDEKAAGDQFLPCCSRSRSAVLVLDL
ncbi:PDR/VanB family oxidoreductase [Burkholderia pseudomultivorans]|uniref:Phthalate dioxygenase reductase n=1 Tax=Burkholderia pseudomultivorans TaxID=1207504 RepID=A0ABU2E8X2_9BURK|nr:PDR/VanB family oxidoreductase [Burkholderia pseudomultivorans]MDR8731555.1 Phthalate dioxygenase reductase [Burkholderia pseudomultivorans]MDR8738187.1 Phthalate dioxygenase reductase [Burkholderia pseudomultivorans]MDR8744514.1 Phthalate dioxygenase reductase [Burkholderia pseudomultivorans]MDR8756324.1 Phthalate dioxygenase reductase [Burkholderia pseudomultivorans]MDR8781059.1 Phthalate dioxygenase reductase [Burkholderia pseudomultivorans]